MTYDFDQLIDRRGTGALKLEALLPRFGRSDLLSMWVADMDFATPPFIIDALRRRLEHPVLGYTVTPPEYYRAIQQWVWDHHGYRVRGEWLAYIPGIVKGIGLVCDYFTERGDEVVIQPPVYHPFRLTPGGLGRKIVYNPLIAPEEAPVGGGANYRMDFAGLAKAVTPRTKFILISNPHNPAGVVWSAEELRRLARFAVERGLIVVSDEIHADMALFGHKHTVFTSVSAEAEECGIVFGAPTKTFNIAGIVSSYCFIPNPKLREGFYAWLEAGEQSDANMMAPIATIAAFSEEGEEWRRQMVEYLEGNVRQVEDYLREHIPEVLPWRPEASYLVWLDCRKLGLNHDELQDLFINRARLALNDGEMFGREGAGFMRLNIGCPRSVVEEALERLRVALER